MNGTLNTNVIKYDKHKQTSSNVDSEKSEDDNVSGFCVTPALDFTSSIPINIQH